MQSSTTSRNLRRGQALIEFAISFFLLWLVFAGLYQFGYSFYVYNNLVTAVSNSAQMGARMQFDLLNRTGATTTLQNMVLYGSTSAGTRTVVPGLTSANVKVTFSPEPSATFPNPVPQFVTVQIDNFSVDAVFRTFTFNGKPRVTTVYMGRICSGSTC